MVGLVAVVVLLAGLVVIGIVVAGLVSARAGTGPQLSDRQRALEAQAAQRARWSVAHDEVDGVTRVLVRRAYAGADGLPRVLEERVFASWPADDPLWEPRFTEAMAGARFRAAYLNAEESA